MRILVTGSGGQVGWELSRSLMPLGEVIAVDKVCFDFTRPETLPSLLREIRPDVVVNAAAYTAVDRAEEEEALATTINGTAVGIMAEEARRSGALFIHYSTDYVFEGRKSEPYTEEDPPCPINAYGRSKLAGDVAIQQVAPDYLILRTTWVYAARGQNFLKTMLRLARERDKLSIVADQFGAPTWARNIADATAHILRQAQGERTRGQFSSGIYNLTASGTTTWYGFTQAILAGSVQNGILEAHRLPELHPIPTEAYPLPAPRPQNSRLDNKKVREHFAVIMPNWEEALERPLSEIALVEHA